MQKVRLTRRRTKNASLDAATHFPLITRGESTFLPIVLPWKWNYSNVSQYNYNIIYKQFQDATEKMRDNWNNYRMKRLPGASPNARYIRLTLTLGWVWRLIFSFHLQNKKSYEWHCNKYIFIALILCILCNGVGFCAPKFLKTRQIQGVFALRGHSQWRNSAGTRRKGASEATP